MTKVYLVGAGPGDPELITLKGKRLLKNADVVVYDQLANPELLNGTAPQAEKIDVGKKAGHHTLPQEQINQLLLQKVREGKNVVRLKGGDPFVFGRGGEEAEFLAENHCSYEVVPGVTSAIAVPAYAGIPVTHRHINSTVTLITGHKADEKNQLDWRHLASDSGTLVFLMGLSNLKKIVQNLIQFGRDPKTLVAVISHGTQNDQKTVTGRLDTIVSQVRSAQLLTPALIVVGEVVSLREKLNWIENRPLFGKKILITRDEKQNPGFVEMLEQRGAVPLVCPLISIQPRKDLHKQVYRLVQDGFMYHWLVFTSENGVGLFFQALLQAGKDTRALHDCRIAVIGEKTAKALQQYGVKADLIPEEYRAEALAEALLQRLLPNDRILLPRAARTREVLKQKLIQAGYRTDELALYDIQTRIEQKEFLLELLPEVDYVTLTSPSAARTFFQCVSPEQYQEIRKIRLQKGKDIRLAAIGTVTAETICSYGGKADVIPAKYTLEKLIQAIEADVKDLFSGEQ